jgi:hypothetical protein
MLVRHRPFIDSQRSQSGIGIPASGSVRYHWSRISPALPSYALQCRGIIIATSHAKHKVRVHPPTALLRMRVGVPPFHTCYPSAYLSLFQRSSRLSTEIHVQYSTACLTVWLCRICLRHNSSIFSRRRHFALPLRALSFYASLPPIASKPR